MKKIIKFYFLWFLIAIFAISCQKKDESSVKLEKFAKELNEAPDKELNNGNLLSGCEYTYGDSLFTYIIKVSDNRYDKLDADSIKRNFSKTIKSDGMAKIVKLLNKSNVGLKYRLLLPENEVSIEFSPSEIAQVASQNTK